MMADVQRIEINEENNPTIEEQNQAAEASEEQTPERPEWLPEKFATPEDMATAYGELETKLSSGMQESTDEESTPANVGALTSDDMQRFSDEWLEKGALSEETYTELSEKYGADRSLVDQYIQGQAALAQGVADRMYAITGGPEKYESMIEWAKGALNQDEIQAFDSLMDGGNEGQMHIAIRGLHARYVAEGGGSAPTVLQGKSSRGSSNAFRSIAELRTAMSDPRYKNDPAYRKDVEERLAVSNVL